MNIFAAIKKAINSDLDKPLNITLNEIKTDVNNLKNLKRKVVTAVNVPNNSTTASQVLSLSSAPVVSVDGSGRLLHVIPIINASSTGEKTGTGLITVDDEILLNSKVQYADLGTYHKGIALVDVGNSMTTISSDMFGSPTSFTLTNGTPLFSKINTYSSTVVSVISPNGVPFKNGFKIRLTHATSANTENVGVIVVYELYE